MNAIFTPNENFTDLMAAVKYGGIDDLKASIKDGADVHAVDKHGFTALGYAVNHRKKRCAIELLAAGADPNTMVPMVAFGGDIGGSRTVLCDAVANNDFDMANLLTSVGADPTIKGSDGSYSAMELSHLLREYRPEFFLLISSYQQSEWQCCGYICNRYGPSKLHTTKAHRSQMCPNCLFCDEDWEYNSNRWDVCVPKIHDNIPTGVTVAHP